MLAACVVVVRSCSPSTGPRSWTGPAVEVVAASPGALRGGRSVAASEANVRSAGGALGRSASGAGRLPVGRRKAGRGNKAEGGRGSRAAPSARPRVVYSAPSSWYGCVGEQPGEEGAPSTCE
eukprot:13754587-Alexandrium_andersonii.AAC.1